MSRKILSLEGVQIGFKNFTGKEGPYNKEGDRNFVVFLDEFTANELVEEGWNVKFPDQPETDDGEMVRQPYLPVTVSFKNIAPTVYLIDEINQQKTILDESTVSLADTTIITRADLIINPSNWTVNGNSGIKAYLKTAYLIMEPAPFFAKYNW